jgi:hypothetical protein
MYRYPNDQKQATIVLAGLTLFAPVGVFLILLSIFSPNACS